MIYDSIGKYPKDTGATDFMDSARLIGLMATFGYNFDLNKNSILDYIQFTGLGRSVAVRCPIEVSSNNPNNFTRDQLVCLVSGLSAAGFPLAVRSLLRAAEDRGCRAQNTEADMPGTKKKFPDGADFLSPSVMNHLRICSGEKPTLIGKLNLVLDIMYNGAFTPLKEQNQLICMCIAAGPYYVKLYKEKNPSYAQAISDYWCGWRGEPNLAAKMIIKLNEY